MSKVLQALETTCNENNELGDHVRFRSLSPRDSEFQPKLSSIIRDQWKEEDRQVALPIIDMTIAGLDMVTEINGQCQTVRQAIVQHAGLLSLENTNSSPHSGRFLAVAKSNNIESTENKLDEALERIYDRNVPMNFQYRRNRSSFPRRQGHSRSCPLQVQRQQSKRHQTHEGSEPDLSEESDFTSEEVSQSSVDYSSSDLGSRPLSPEIGQNQKKKTRKAGTTQSLPNTPKSCSRTTVQSDVGGSIDLKAEVQQLRDKIDELRQKRDRDKKTWESEIESLKLEMNWWYYQGKDCLKKQDEVTALCVEDVDFWIRRALRPLLVKMGILDLSFLAPATVSPAELSTEETPVPRQMTLKAMEHLLHEVKCHVLRHNSSLIVLEGTLHELTDRMNNLQEPCPPTQQKKTGESAETSQETALLKKQLEREVARNEALESRLLEVKQWVKECKKGSTAESPEEWKTANLEAHGNNPELLSVWQIGDRVDAHIKAGLNYKTENNLSLLRHEISTLKCRINILEDLEEDPGKSPTQYVTEIDLEAKLNTLRESYAIDFWSEQEVRQALDRRLAILEPCSGDDDIMSQIMALESQSQKTGTILGNLQREIKSATKNANQREPPGQGLSMASRESSQAQRIDHGETRTEASPGVLSSKPSGGAEPQIASKQWEKRLQAVENKCTHLPSL